MFNEAKLRGKMAEHRITISEAAQALSINPVTYHRKLNGESEFTRKEIQKLIALLNLSSSEVEAIFFSE